MAKKKTSPKHLHYDYLRTKRGRAVPWADSKTIAEGLLLASPGELADDVKRFQVTREHPQTDPGYSVLEFILRSLEKDAKTILNKKHSEGVQVESAEDVLTRSMEIRNAIDKGMAEEDALRMMFLTASAIRMTTHDYTLQGKYETAKQIVRGINRGDEQISARKPEWAKWQKEADKILKKHPTWGKSKVAEMVHEKFPDVPAETIRPRIKKPSV